MVEVLALATLSYGGLVVNASPMLYGIGDAHNAWTLSEMIRFDLVRIEEMDVGACMNIRYRTRGAPPSHLVQPADCAGPHSAEVIGIHLVDGPADGDVAAQQLLAEEVCAAGWERVGHAYGGQVSWIVRRDGSPRERSVICGVDDTA